ncbi:MAG: DUF992 domain-containing protein [Hyphomicrobiales bacterium]
MKKTIAAALAAISLLTLPALAADADQPRKSGIKVGILTCRVDSGVGWIIGSSKAVACVFKNNNGRKERYVGRIGKLGVDIGITNQSSIAWAVFAPGRLKPGSLKGSYTGASAEATIAVGLGANVLIGGFRKSINLQPLSLQAQTGLNVAAGIASLNLERVK